MWYSTVTAFTLEWVGWRGVEENKISAMIAHNSKILGFEKRCLMKGSEASCFTVGKNNVCVWIPGNLYEGIN